MFMNGRRNIFSTKRNILERTSQDTMEKMLSARFKDSPVKLLIMSGFTLCCSTNVENIVLPITGLTLKQQKLMKPRHLFLGYYSKRRGGLIFGVVVPVGSLIMPHLLHSFSWQNSAYLQVTAFSNTRFLYLKPEDTIQSDLRLRMTTIILASET